MAVAGLLAQYMSIKAQISYVELQDTRWNDLATSMSKKVSEQTTLEDKWNDAYDDAEEACNDDKELKLKGTRILKKKSDVKNGERLASRQESGWVLEQSKFCEKFANQKVPKFNREKLDEYTDLDMEYSTMVAMYDTLLEELNTQAESTKSQLSTESQDNHMLGQ